MPHFRKRVVDGEIDLALVLQGHSFGREHSGRCVTSHRRLNLCLSGRHYACIEVNLGCEAERVIQGVKEASAAEDIAHPVVAIGWLAHAVILGLNLLNPRQNPEMSAVVSRFHKPKNGSMVSLSFKLLALVVCKHLQDLRTSIEPWRPLAHKLGVKLLVLGVDVVDAALGDGEAEHSHSLTATMILRKALEAECIEVAVRVLGKVSWPLLRGLLGGLGGQLVQAELVVRRHHKLNSFQVGTRRHEGARRWA
mmetsp:Transcript_76364/g.223957  ORF Transcript_76364/g.223957 Transcript_76364/m.223957 type:complete len:251 (-) Transcript_76364:368-1120(-)